MRHQDGSLRFEMIERDLRLQGYALEICCRYGEHVPEDLGFTGRESGWELRRKLKAWCAANGHTDFHILRNTSYHRDLVGTVYELWVRPTAPTSTTSA